MQAANACSSFLNQLSGPGIVFAITLVPPLKQVQNNYNCNFLMKSIQNEKRKICNE